MDDQTKKRLRNAAILAGGVGAAGAAGVHFARKANAKFQAEQKAFQAARRRRALKAGGLYAGLAGLGIGAEILGAHLEGKAAREAAENFGRSWDDAARGARSSYRSSGAGAGAGSKKNYNWSGAASGARKASRKAEAASFFVPGGKAADADIHKAYRNMAFKNHPDRGGDPEKMKEINKMYDMWKHGAAVQMTAFVDEMLRIMRGV